MRRPSDTARRDYLDAYAREQHLGSRSAALQKAVRLLRASELGADYEAAWAEWERYPFQMLLPAEDTGLQHDSRAHAEQVRAVAVERVRSTLGTLTAPSLAELDEAVRLRLAP